MEGGVQEMPGLHFQLASPSGSPEQHFVLLAMMDDFLCNAEMALYFTMHFSSSQVFREVILSNRPWKYLEPIS